MGDPVPCPFCGEPNESVYAALLHNEFYHSEGHSPFVPLDDPTESHATERVEPAPSSSITAAPESDDSGVYVECPIESCGEVMFVSDLEYHLELHGQEEDQPANSDSQVAVGEPGSSTPRKKGSGSRRSHGSPDERTPTGPSSDPQSRAILDWKYIFARPVKRRSDGSSSSASKPKRLGKAELGRYAHEKKMPDWLVTLLRKGGAVKADGIVPVLDQLLQQSPTTTIAYLCHPKVQHISKLRREGGFCGYRNIQMQVSYINGANSQGKEAFNGKIPTVFELQEYIEKAWDMGINTHGRVETGGVRGTRKFIGTPEAQAVYCSLGIACNARAFKDRVVPLNAMNNLLTEVEKYFQSGVRNPEAKVHCTDMPPLYFQHRGHSLTIVGLEKQNIGRHEFTSLLVFDPTFSDSSSVKKLVGKTFDNKEPDRLLSPYRRGLKYLQRYQEFELLMLTPPHLDE